VFQKRQYFKNSSAATQHAVNWKAGVNRRIPTPYSTLHSPTLPIGVLGVQVDSEWSPNVILMESNGSPSEHPIVQFNIEVNQVE
jgi:hypothetical protein